MESLSLQIQKDDWKKEKHVPVIELKEPAKKGEPINIHLCVGKEIPHPNTTEHHIRWIKLFFQPDGEKFSIHLGTYTFEAHAESVEGPNKGPAKCEPCVHTSVILEKPGTLIALSYCNIHGLWENSLRVDFEN
ncbi:MAG: superoxide reductase [Tepidanaerobacteraceae bacterium]|nr:superoxide reductase [Tepidanaerobacteraceae bacterium]